MSTQYPAQSEPAERIATPGSSAAERAVVRVAVPLDEHEADALRQALIRVFGKPLELAIETRPEILGGVWVRVGDTVVDGSLRGKLEALRHHLRTQCTSMVAAGGRAEPQGKEAA